MMLSKEELIACAMVWANSPDKVGQKAADLMAQHILAQAEKLAIASEALERIKMIRPCYTVYKEGTDGFDTRCECCVANAALKRMSK